ncbi:MAG: ATP-binding cassette domain-containing protein [Candidatus Korarchaeum sp.]|nr:ATP-binding cassette domain-containing protein [Candidatus Korarchaeum sp.]MDW8035644.1 ATP-binding cassette domain-containing protein [Candidatus Korarchaeum sp.]
MIEVKGLRVKLEDFEINGLDLEVGEGEYLVVMGPSGAGKTLLLQCMLGVVKPISGRVIVDGRDVTDVPPELRGFSYVPQDYALFPHMSVLDNIAFGLRVRGLSGVELRKRVEEITEIMGISHLLSKKPATLSGGEKQRVALARGLIVSPKALLLDEPLSALHRAMREELQVFIRKLHERLRFTAVHVTHDILEASYLGDRVAVMSEGRLLKVGKLEELFEDLSDKRVADVLGYENLLKGVARREGQLTSIRLGGLELKSAYEAEGEALILIRPEDVYVHHPSDVGRVSARNVLRATVESLEYRPPVYLVSFRVGNLLLRSSVTKQVVEDFGISKGKEFVISVKATAVKIIPSNP